MNFFKPTKIKHIKKIFLLFTKFSLSDQIKNKHENSLDISDRSSSFFNTQMGRTVFIDKDVVSTQLNSLPTNQFSFGFLCGQSTRSERDYIHYIIDGVTSKQTDIDSFFVSSPTNKDSTNNELWAKIIEITSSLCAGVSIIGFYCRAKADALKSTNFTLKIRRLFEILQTALRTYSSWSLTQSSHRILLQSEIGSGANKWLVKTMDMSSDNVHFRPVEMKTYDSSTSPMWCMTTMIPLQFNVWLSSININDDKNIKLIENQFEEQWKQYIDTLKVNFHSVEKEIRVFFSKLFRKVFY